jgi:hypothetical protein
MTCDMTRVVIGILNVRWRGKIPRSEYICPKCRSALSFCHGLIIICFHEDAHKHILYYLLGKVVYPAQSQIPLLGHGRERDSNSRRYSLGGCGTCR